MDNKRIGIIIGLLAVAAGIAALWWIGPEESEDSLTLYGNVDIREVDLAFRVSGRLQTMRRYEGAAVSAGDVVATLDAEPYREALEAAEARVAQARAELAKRRAGSRPQEIELARARVAEARADARNAREELTRQEKLIEQEATSQRQLDQAQARFRAAQARLRSAREQLELTEDGFRDEDIALAEAEAESARTRLDDAELIAPSDGRILTRAREPGTILAAGQTVYTLSLEEPVWIRAYVDEPDLGGVRPGMDAVVTTDSSDREFSGQVGFISPKAEFTPKTVQTEALRTDLVYRLRIVVPEDHDELRQGMPVTVRLATDGEAAR